MTGIMTITAGQPGAGVTHLALNLALEQVRRGRQAGVFCQRDARSSVERLLELRQPVSMLRRVDDLRERGLLRSGYQGMDILSCGTPLHDWPRLPAAQRARCLDELDVPGGYDTFLIDTSGMDARTQLACCHAAQRLLVVVTPAPQTQASAFGLLRVLLLNGFQGELRLLVNKIEHPSDTVDIHAAFSAQVSAVLGRDIALLGGVPADAAVERAGRARQAFSSLLPESQASAAVVALADELDELAASQADAGQADLAGMWEAIMAALQRPVRLPGHATLADAADELPTVVEDETVAGAAQHAETGSMVEETGLLKFTGTLASLPALQARLAADYEALLQILGRFAACSGRDRRQLAGVPQEPLQAGQLPGVVAQLLGLLEADRLSQSVAIEVLDIAVAGEDPAWLRAGHYLKCVFQLQGTRLPEAARSLLQSLPGISEPVGTDGEHLYELVDQQHQGCLDVVDDPHHGVRLQVWLPRSLTGVEDRGARSARRAPGA